MIEAYIVDDEPELRELNQVLLEKNFPEISVIGSTGTVNKAVEFINEHKPQLLILDIRLTDGTGFNILQKIHPYNYALIFVTAYNEFAIKAIQFSAIDYILKPIEEVEFCSAVDKALSSINNSKLQEQVRTFFNYYEKKTQNRRIVLKTFDAINIVDVSDIVYCRSESNYTTFYFKNGSKIMVSRVLKDYEEMLTEYGFFRPHQSFLVNLLYITKLDKSDGGFLILKNGTEVPVSLRRKKKLIQVLENL
ncbi:MAG: LytTR family DNA-binding domain-containing protein [Prolixibacteraceae bacterium]|jgi:two-component system LytT family response regulator|nr:LytTR family DNA-binding domain-containing protein [Prolixibacteraceae bacterium]